MTPEMELTLQNCILNIQSFLLNHHDFESDSKEGLKCDYNKITALMSKERNDFIRSAAKNPTATPYISQEEIFDALYLICRAVELAGCSSQLTAVSVIASELRGAIGNRFNKPRPDSVFYIKQLLKERFDENGHTN